MSLLLLLLILVNSMVLELFLSVAARVVGVVEGLVGLFGVVVISKFSSIRCWNCF